MSLKRGRAMSDEDELVEAFHDARVRPTALDLKDEEEAQAGERSPGPIQKLLQQEAEQRRRLRERQRRVLQAASAASSSSTSASSRRRPSSACGEASGRRRSSFTQPTYQSAIRKRETLDHGCLSAAEVALLEGGADEDCSTTASTHLGGETAAAAWENFQRRNDTFLEEREQFLEVLRLQKFGAELEECTFEPRILSRPPREPDSHKSLYEKGLERQARREERLERLRREQEAQELAKCSFRPATNWSPPPWQGATTRSQPSTPRRRGTVTKTSVTLSSASPARGTSYAANNLMRKAAAAANTGCPPGVPSAMASLARRRSNAGSSRYGDSAPSSPGQSTFIDEALPLELEDFISSLPRRHHRRGKDDCGEKEEEEYASATGHGHYYREELDSYAPKGASVGQAAYNAGFFEEEFDVVRER